MSYVSVCEYILKRNATFLCGFFLGPRVMVMWPGVMRNLNISFLNNFQKKLHSKIWNIKKVSARYMQNNFFLLMWVKLETTIFGFLSFWGNSGPVSGQKLIFCEHCISYFMRESLVQARFSVHVWWGTAESDMRQRIWLEPGAVQIKWDLNMHNIKDQQIQWEINVGYLWC